MSPVDNATTEEHEDAVHNAALRIANAGNVQKFVLDAIFSLAGTNDDGWATHALQQLSDACRTLAVVIVNQADEVDRRHYNDIPF